MLRQHWRKINERIFCASAYEKFSGGMAGIFAPSGCRFFHIETVQ